MLETGAGNYQLPLLGPGDYQTSEPDYDTGSGLFSAEGSGIYTLRANGEMHIGGRSHIFIVHALIRYPIFERIQREYAERYGPYSFDGVSSYVEEAGRHLSLVLDSIGRVRPVHETTMVDDTDTTTQPVTATFPQVTRNLTMYGQSGRTSFRLDDDGRDWPAMTIGFNLIGRLVHTVRVEALTPEELSFTSGDGDIVFDEPPVGTYNLDLVFNVFGSAYNTDTAAGLRFYISGGTSNTDNAASLGGAISTTQISAATGLMFPDITARKSRIGITDHYCLYIKNEGTETMIGGIIYNPVEPSVGSTVLLGIAEEGISTTVQLTSDSELIQNEIDFTNSHTPQNALALPDLAVGEYIGIWVGRKANEDNLNSLASDTFGLRVGVIDNLGI